VTHGNPITGEEPTMEQYFFARVRPIVEQALKDGNRRDWPLISSTWISRTTSPNTWPRYWPFCESTNPG
jgi:hypothetical protein